MRREWWLDYVRPVDVDEDVKLQWITTKPMPVTQYGVPLIPKGFVTDLGSIPRALWWMSWLSPWGPGAPAFILHDYDYATEMSQGDGTDGVLKSMCSRARARADRRLYDNLQGLYASHRCKLLYSGVRVGGWNGWRKHTPESVAAAQALVL